MTLDVIAYAYRYNAWATDLLLESMEQLTPEQYAAPGCSGHGSIRDTFAHFMSSQHAWVSWYEGKITVSDAIKLRLHTANHGTHTRAQVVAAIRRAGYNPGNIEMLRYVMTHPDH